jgi:hypothetical protein
MILGSGVAFAERLDYICVMVNEQMAIGSKSPEVQTRYALNTVEPVGVSVFKRNPASRMASGLVSESNIPFFVSGGKATDTKFEV